MPPGLAIPGNHTCSTHPSFGDSGSPCILYTPPPVAIPVHHVSQTRRPLIWWFRLLICFERFERSSTLGDNGSSHILSEPPHLAIPVPYPCQTHALIWRYRVKIYLND